MGGHGPAGPPGRVDAVLRAARESHRAGRADEARRGYGEVLRARPDDPDALHGLGVLALQSRDPPAATTLLTRLVALRPRDASAHNLLGLALTRLGRLAEAAATLERAVALDKRHAEAWANLGIARHDGGDLAGAETALEKAVRLAPRLVFALNALGMVRRDRGRHAEAAAAYRKALAVAPEEPLVWRNLGNALQQANDLAGAAEAFGRALALRPGEGRALTLLVHVEQRRCRWDALGPLEARVHEHIGAGVPDLDPLVLLALEATPAERLAAARRTCAAEFSHIRPMAPAPAASRAAGAPITVGYLSPDFGDHPVAHLIPAMIEAHDRARVTVVGYSLRADDRSPIRRRLEGAFDRFVDLAAVPDADAAARIRADGVDVLVDLAGHTQGARLGIAARRPCPVQATYLGFPGSTGAPFLDYLIADRYVAPPEAAADFSECLVRLPGCYLVADPGREIGPAPERAACGLPETGPVLCAFHRADKIRPAVFGVWMRLLAAVPDAVLWLSVAGEAAENLRREAARRGVDPGRLRLAGRVADPGDHLARLALADLFLDTSPYNAHATAVDAVQAGVPPVTCPGAGFAGRVGGSLLTALGLSELVAPDLAAYEATALRLAADPDARGALRARLAAARGAGTPFDPAGHARHMEAAYGAMWERHAAGRSPAPIDVAPAPP